MKKQLLTVFTLLVTAVILAQGTYTFSASNETYQDLTGGVSLNNGEVWDDPTYTIPVGFNFQLNSLSLNTVYIDGLGGDLTTTIDGSISNVGFIILIAQDLIDLGFANDISVSPISYVIEGAVGNRILKIEWKNAGFYNDDTESDFINMQLWLFEGTNVLEYHFGSSEVNNPTQSYEDLSGAIVGLFPLFDSDEGNLLDEGYLLYELPQNPAVRIFEPGDDVVETALNGTIPVGTVYRFTPGILSVANFDTLQFKIYPNPATNFITLQVNTEDYKVTIYNELGQKVNTTKPLNNTIDISELSNGMYFITVESSTGLTTKKFIKK